MDAESPSQGSDIGDADPPKPAVAPVGPKVTPGFRHHLPQIPMMNMGHKIAQSKASAKQDISKTAMDNLQAHETTQLHIEGTGKIVEISGSGRQEEIFTPPETESSSNSSPGDSKPPVKNGSSKDKYGDMTGTPIKLRIRRANRDGELDLSSCVDEAPQNSSVVDNSFNVSVSTPGQLNTSSHTPGSLQKRGKPKRGRPKAGAIKLNSPAAVVTPKSNDKSPKWLVGDLVWSKVSGHPWWPCMISYDPFDGIYTKLRQGRLYHVQFFGDEGERGWVTESCTMPFEGRQALEEYFKILQVKATAKQKTQYKLEVSARRRHAWEIAYKSAEEAMSLSKAERKQKYTYVYEAPPAKGAGDNQEAVVNKTSEEDTGTGRTKTKAKLKKALITARTSRLQGQGGMGPATPTSEEGLNGESTSKRGRKRKQTQYSEGTDSEEEREDNQPSPRRKRKKLDTSVDNAGENNSPKKHHSASAPKSEGSFEVFCKKLKHSAMSEHPEFDEKTLSEYLKQQWDMLDSKQKSRYRSKLYSRADRSGEEADLSPKARSLVKYSGRVSKPSVKKLEAEETKKPGSPPTRRSSHNGMLGEAEDLSDKAPMSSHDGPAEENPAAPIETKGNKPKVTKPEDESKSDGNKKRRSRKLEHSDSTDSDSQSETQSTASRRICPQIRSEDGETPILTISNMTSAFQGKKENVCLLCEESGELIVCEGPCGGSFHAQCLGIGVGNNTNFKCDECTSGKHSCFSCKESSEDTERCIVPQCGRFYHKSCVLALRSTRKDPKGFICPLHTCTTCAAESPKNTKAHKGRLLRCVRCPVAYHVGDYCIAAGSKPLAGCNIICSKHFKPVKKRKARAHDSFSNVAWCFVCNKGGTLLCCETCPAAFHHTCLNINTPEGSWYCHDCTSGRRPLYGDIVWIKLGTYRWWPGEICHPRNIPPNIMSLKHHVGEFPVRFFGSDEYYWVHQGRVFLFQEGDKSSRESSGNKKMAAVFRKAIQEGIHALRVWKTVKENKAQQEAEKNDKKPAPYKHIKANIPYGNLQIHKPDLSELPRCECKPTQESPCGSDSECVNRMLMYECHPALCPAGEKCMNQRFQKREYPESVPFRTAGRGWGLKTLIDIKKGQFVNEYVGDLVDEEECRRRIDKAHEDNITNFYMLTVSKSRVIDAGPKGNFSRFMNHSCQPNLETQKWTINGEVRVGLFALEDIPAGSELTFNYNLDCLGNEKTVCACGAPICSGFLGVRPKTSAAAANEKRVKEVKKRKKKKPKVDVKKQHDDDCFRCGEGGELVMCDKTACPKAYHLQCLNLAKPPHGKWVCPWHHCDECGKPASQLCSECPNSFCKSHIENKIFLTEDGKLICWEHDELLSSLTVKKVDPSGIKDVSDGEKYSVNGESPVTDSDSQMSAEESDKMDGDNPADTELKNDPEAEPKKKAGNKNRSISKVSKHASPSNPETVEKVSRTGRKIKRPSLDFLEVNGIEETKPKKPKAKKRVSKSKADTSLSQSADTGKDDSNPASQSGVKENLKVTAVEEDRLFDDSDEEGFGGLVIDIPTV